MILMLITKPCYKVIPKSYITLILFTLKCTENMTIVIQPNYLLQNVCKLYILKAIGLEPIGLLGLFLSEYMVCSYSGARTGTWFCRTVVL